MRTPEQAKPAWAIERADWLRFAPGVRRGSVDLLYADPPFNTGKPKSTPPRAPAAGRTARATYRDTWPSLDSYLAWLRERLQATMPALRPSGSILLHLDYRTSHRARVLLDDLLGPDRFVNHLIWSYGLGGSSPRRFARKHDDILWYCVDPRRYWFEAPRVPATSRLMAGQTKKATDVLDIPSINNMSRERTGYPTQKPLALLDLLVRACCPPDGVVLDPCCGSGTTLAAAVSAGRCAVGCDTNPDAIRIARERLSNAARRQKAAFSTRPPPRES